MATRLRWLARAVLALFAALVAIVLVNLAGGELSDRMPGLRDGGTVRLAADLGWWFVAGVVATSLVVRIAAVAKAAHALGFAAICLVVASYAAAGAWHDFPRWFLAGIVLSVPAQAWLGWWLARGRARVGRAPPRH